ncbi:mRNA splicing factor [Chytriomyces sp. MP71]|nr:mRNA splicing factor [Chytriomyces sp. MP71]
MADSGRKARLAELRRLKESAEKGGDGDETHAVNKKGDAEVAHETEADKKIAFRNYNPLTEHVRTLATPAEDSVPENASPKKAQDTLESRAKQIEQDAKELLEKQAKPTEEVEIASLAPRKPGFDLARDLERRMEKLEKKTNYAIAENIRQRFKDSHDISEVGGVTSGGQDDGEDEDFD